VAVLNGDLSKHTKAPQMTLARRCCLDSSQAAKRSDHPEYPTFHRRQFTFMIFKRRIKELWQRPVQISPL
jgi:hypothetical protein